jgi:hypothetical protein
LSQDEIFTDGKSRSEFERVKQKFDSRNSGKSYHASSSAKNSSRKSDRLSGSQRAARISDMHFDDSKPSMNHDNSPVFDCEATVSQPGFQKQLKAQISQEKQDNTIDLASSFNLDGFKVSEDDDDGDVSSSFV